MEKNAEAYLSLPLEIMWMMKFSAICDIPNIEGFEHAFVISPNRD